MITQVEEFKEIIEGQYGIKDLKTYDDYKMKVGNGNLTKAEVELLSPDNVNSCSFWEYIDKNPEIAKDAIAFGVTKDRTIDDVNSQNLGLAWSLNALSFLMLYKDEVNAPILDIGAGYGMLKEFIKKNTRLKYYGVDVYPKIDGVLQIGPDGSTLPPTIAAMTFGMIISVNVFQHLSIKQRRHYYEQIAKILHPGGGIFTVTISTVNLNSVNVKKPFICKENGKGYTCHYGQYVECQSYPEVIADLQKHFTILSLAHRTHDDSFTFHCVRKPEPPPVAYDNTVTLADSKKA